MCKAVRVALTTIAVSWLLVTLAFAQQPQKFRISAAGGRVSGTEEFRVTKTTQGFAVTGKGHIVTPSVTIESTQDQLFDSAWAPIRYKLDVQRGLDKQSVEAVRKTDKKGGDTIEMKATTAAGTKQETVDLGSRGLLLDNLVVSHFQALLNATGGKAGANDRIRVIVPQALAASPATFADAGEDPGTLDGKAITLKKYTLAVEPTAVEIWAQKETNALMRVVVASQGVEILREGFTPGK